MAASDDERWPDTDIYTFGRENTDHLQQLRETKKHHYDEHSSPLTNADEEIKLQAETQEKLKAQQRKEEDIRHHMFE